MNLYEPAGGLSAGKGQTRLMKLARPAASRYLDDKRGLRAALCFFDFQVDRRFPELSVRTAVPEYL